MRVLRFSLVLTIFLFTLLPALTGFVLGMLIFVQNLFSHLVGEQAGLAMQWQAIFNAVLLTVIHGLMMYGVLSLVLGIAVAFFLDRGLSYRQQWLFSLVAALLTIGWAKVTVEFTGSYTLIFMAALVSYFWAIRAWSVAPEERTTPRIFDNMDE